MLCLFLPLFSGFTDTPTGFVTTLPTLPAFRALCKFHFLTCDHETPQVIKELVSCSACCDGASSAGAKLAACTAEEGTRGSDLHFTELSFERA